MIHFLDVDSLTPSQFKSLLDQDLNPEPVLRNKSVALIFEKPSLRTRHSTELAVSDLGGKTITSFDFEVGLERRERAVDVARVLSQYHDYLCFRVFDHTVLDIMAHAISGAGLSSPIINMLSDKSHPMQAVADVLTIKAHALKLGLELKELKVVWLGDPNNVFNSLLKALSYLDTGLNLIAPSELCEKFESDFLDKWSSHLTISNGVEMLEGAHIVYVDTWISMGEKEDSKKLLLLKNYQLNESLMRLTDRDCAVLHCLPAHVGDEITEDVFESHLDTIMLQAKNRRYGALKIFKWFCANE